MSRILSLQNARFRWVRLPGQHSVRWVAWKPWSEEALLVGNRGTAIRWQAGTLELVPAPTSENLRGAAWHPSAQFALVVGNAGTILRFEDGSWERIPFFSAVALRRVAWSPDGQHALIVGNDGLALRYGGGRVTTVGFAHHHLRSIAFHPTGVLALIAGNRALYRYEEGALDLVPVHQEPGGDLIAAAFRPDGAEALVAGFRSSETRTGGREAVLYRWTLKEITLAAEPLPDQVWVGLAWDRDGQGAWLVSNPGLSPTPSLIARWEYGRIFEILRHPTFRFTGVFPAPTGKLILFPGSTASPFWTV